MKSNRNMEIHKGLRIQHADISDPQEVRIRGIISKTVENTQFGKDAIEQVRRIQKGYLQKSLGLLDRPNEIYRDTQKTLKDIARICNSQIIEGASLLSEIPKKNPVLIALNHFGLNKLTTLRPEEIGLSEQEFESPVEEIYPFTAYYASLFPLAEILEDDLLEAHLQMPGKKLPRLQEAAGLLVIPPQHGLFNLLKDKAMELFAAHPNGALVIFPEGETSGKRSERGPYDLEQFHSGAWGIATELAKAGIKVPVISAYQYWNSESGFEVEVVKIDIVSANTTRDEQEKMAKNSQQSMQRALDLRAGKSK